MIPLGLLVLFILIGILGSSSEDKSATGPTTPTTLLAADVDAARACQAWSVFAQSAGDGATTPEAGQALTDGAGVVLNGAAAAKAAGQPPPKWAGLGADMVVAAGELNSGDDAQFGAHADKIAAACGSLPQEVKDAGGFVRPSVGKKAKATVAPPAKSTKAKFTLDKYNQLQNGMTYDQVKAIAGGEPQSASNSDTAGMKMDSYTWPGDGLGDLVMLTFVDGQLYSKTQVGLGAG